jgi:heme-degrading monooxygenase HmoA
LTASLCTATLSWNGQLNHAANRELTEYTMIMRIWRGITPKEQADAYLEHLQQTALPALKDFKGQRGAWVLRRVQGEQCEFQVLTLWDSMKALHAYAGKKPERAVYYDEDDKYLLDMEPLVRHYEVADTVPPH